MGLDLADEKEFELLREECRRSIRAGIPNACLWVCILAATVYKGLSPFVPIAATYMFIMIALNLFQLWVWRALDMADLKRRSAHRTAVFMLLFLFWYWMNFAFEEEGNRELVQGARHVLLPLASAWECRNERRPLFWAGPLLLSSGMESLLRLFAEGQRCFVNLTAICIICLVMQGRADLDGDKEDFVSVCRTVRKLLNSVCDGYCVLDEKGAICGADRKLLSLLGVGLEALQGQPLASFMEEASVGEGLRHARLLTPCQAVSVEVYTVPGDFTSASLRELLGHWCLAVEGRVKGSLCAVRESGAGEEASTVQSSTVACIGGPACGGRADESGTVEEDLLAPSEAGEEEDAASELLSQAPSVQRGAGACFFPSMGILGIGVGEYAKGSLVYRGGMTTVWQAKGPSGQAYALKEVRLQGVLWRRDFPKNLVRADRELRGMKRFQWASCVVVQIVEGWLREDMVLCIVMEWLPTTLRSVLEARRQEGRGPPQQAGWWFAQVAAGLAVVHAGGYMHRDLKASNLLLTADLQTCKIADFGLSRELHCGPSRSTLAGSDDGSVLSGYTAGCGTKGYMSPEVRQDGRYGTATDIFSLGCILLELLTLQGTEAPRTQAAASQLFATQPTSELAPLCLQMLDEDPKRRPTALGLTQAQALAPHVRALLDSHPELQRVLGEQDSEHTAAVLCMDSRCQILHWSSSLAATLGVPADQALGGPGAQPNRELPDKGGAAGAGGPHGPRDDEAAGEGKRPPDLPAALRQDAL